MSTIRSVCGVAIDVGSSHLMVGESLEQGFINLTQPPDFSDRHASIKSLIILAH